MTQPTPEELLRLARKAFPGQLSESYPIVKGLDGVEPPGYVEMYDTRLVSLIRIRGPKYREALHAALLVLAGELDVAALVKRAESE